VGNPYRDTFVDSKTRIREFIGTPDSELVWHRDHNNREITVLSGNGWKLQLDNSMPTLLEENNKYCIPKGVYHRLIKGRGDLKLKIVENFC
jgi:quercetin dioxygenase-like cupin family protein